MLIIKKLLFAPLFLGLLYLAFYFIQPFFESYNRIFSYNLDTILQSLIISALLLSAAFFYIVFLSLADDWVYIIPTVLLAGLLGVLVFPLKIALIISGGLILILLLISLTTKNTLKTYINFSPNQLFYRPIKNLAILTALVLAFGFYLNVNSQIQEKGFEVPDSFLDMVVNMALSSQGIQVRGEKYYLAQGPTITEEQLELLRQHPELLEQYGLDPKILDTIKPTQSGTPKKTTPSTEVTQETTAPSNDFLKAMVKGQLERLIKPYLGMIPVVLAALFFASYYTFISLLSLLVPLLLWLLFYILEKSKFIHFDKEMREVKKLVV
jgi:hypothetical protein